MSAAFDNGVIFPNMNFENVIAKRISASVSLSSENLTSVAGSVRNLSALNLSSGGKAQMNELSVTRLSAANLTANSLSPTSIATSNLTATNLTATTISATNLSSDRGCFKGLSAYSAADSKYLDVLGLINSLVARVGTLEDTMNGRTLIASET